MLYRIALSLVILLGITARSLHMTDIDSRSPDEYSYTTYAMTLADHGLPAYRAAFAEYNRAPDLWVHPSPARFGYVAVTALVMKATGNRNARAGAAVSWFFSVLSLFLVAWIGLRFFNRPVAWLAVFFMAINFAELAMARRAWQDSTFGFLGLLLVALACAITAKPQSRRAWPAFFAVGFYCLLIKESGYVAYGLCWLWLLFAVRSHARQLLLGGFVSALAAIAVISFVAGGFSPVLLAQQHILKGTAESAYGYYYDGAWYRFFYLLWLTGPITSLMAALGLGLALSKRDNRAALLAALVTTVFICIGAFGPKLQYLRLLSPVEGTYCLLAATGLWYVFSQAKSLLGSGEILIPVTALGLGWVAVHDYSVYTQVIVASGMQDLAGRTLLTVMGK